MHKLTQRRRPVEHELWVFSVCIPRSKLRNNYIFLGTRLHL